MYQARARKCDVTKTLGEIRRIMPRQGKNCKFFDTEAEGEVQPCIDLACHSKVRIRIHNQVADSLTEDHLKYIKAIAPSQSIEYDSLVKLQKTCRNLCSGNRQAQNEMVHVSILNRTTFKHSNTTDMCGRSSSNHLANSG